VTSVVDLTALLLPVLGVGDGTVEGEDAVPEVPGLGVPELGVGVPEDAEDVGLAVADPVGAADGVLDGGAVCRCREVWPPDGELSGGLPTASWNTMMAATTTTKNSAAVPP